MPASGKTLLDSSVLVAALRGEDAVLFRFRETGKEFFIPAIAVGELFYGAHKSGNRAKNLSLLQGFFQDKPILAVDMETAGIYGEIKSRLRERGTLIPENDIWIAAIAKRHGMALAARDSHFKNVEDLIYEEW
jgi:tRNA(fMet)-specific endonuclease VapC